jgi:hypothetical protein
MSTLDEQWLNVADRFRQLAQYAKVGIALVEAADGNA